MLVLLEDIKRLATLVVEKVEKLGNVCILWRGVLYAFMGLRII